MKLLYSILPLTILSQEQASSSNNTCTDQLEGCPLWLAALVTPENPTPKCRENWKTTCQKTCNTCEDPEINAQVAKQSIADNICKDLDEVICSNIKDNPTICLTSENHRATCMKSCNRCDADILAEMAVNTVDKIDEMMEQLQIFEEKDDAELMSDFIKQGSCKDIYPETCTKMVALDLERISCKNEQLKKLCAKTCDTCEEILQPWLDKAKDIGNSEIEAGEKVKEKLNEVVEGVEGANNSGEVTNEENESEESKDETSINEDDDLPPKQVTENTPNDPAPLNESKEESENQQESENENQSENELTPDSESLGQEGDEISLEDTSPRPSDGNSSGNRFAVVGYTMVVICMSWLVL